MPDLPEDADLWFDPVDESLDPTADGFTGYPDIADSLTGAPAALLRAARERIPTWESLGFTDEESSAGYRDGRLWIGLELGDRSGRSTVGFVRVEITATDWTGAWVDASRGTQPVLDDAGPTERTGGTYDEVDDGVRGAIAWFEAQLRRPIVRRTWQTGGRITGRQWALDDTGRRLVASGQVPADPSTADETVRVRP